jgi:diguanylate cyclase (GGDEF)-like protein
MTNTHFVAGSFYMPFFVRITLLRFFDSIKSLYNKRILLAWLDVIKKWTTEFFLSSKFHISFIVLAFLALTSIRLVMHAFGFSLGYLYLILICISGIWFGFKGGIVTATISSFIFLAEITIFKDWLLRDVVANSCFLRICSFYAGGLLTAYLSKLKRSLREARALAYYDELTGVINYRWLMQTLDGEVNRCARYGKNMTVIMIDIDHFKRVNDTYGHITGNLILKSFAEVLKNNLRNVDMVGRYGGDEFLIILPEASHEDAKVVLDRIKDKLMGIRLPYSHDKEKMGGSLSFSAGVSSFSSNGKTLEELINASDVALYHAKRCGRNKVISERRRWVRLNPAPDLKIDLVKDMENASSVLRILNISKHGSLLALSENVKGRNVTCRVSFLDNKQSFDLKCEIMHKEKTDRGFYLVGLYFDELPKQIEDRILDYRHKEN